MRRGRYIPPPLVGGGNRIWLRCRRVGRFLHAETRRRGEHRIHDCETQTPHEMVDCAGSRSAQRPPRLRVSACHSPSRRVWILKCDHPAHKGRGNGPSWSGHGSLARSGERCRGTAAVRLSHQGPFVLVPRDVAAAPAGMRRASGGGAAALEVSATGRSGMPAPRAATARRLASRCRGPELGTPRTCASRARPDWSRASAPEGED
jgi:hypothetical protein